MLLDVIRKSDGKIIQAAPALSSEAADMLARGLCELAPLTISKGDFFILIGGKAIFISAAAFNNNFVIIKHEGESPLLSSVQCGYVRIMVSGENRVETLEKLAPIMSKLAEIDKRASHE